ncbi:Germin-like protein subfamily 1 member 20 [Hirschfeldia incana]|nr:Germin-like protein subfamily 1 member 20 [Hirschfeldia incana]
MRFTQALIPIAILALVISFAEAYDPNPLQDFCVAIDDLDGVFVNGRFCKDPRRVNAEDFFFSGLNVPGNTDNQVGSNVTTVNVDQIPGLNTMGISLVRIDYAPYGQNPPHTHPRGSEILVLIKGTLYVGFVSSNQDNNRLFAKVLHPGDVFVFPIGMIHFQVNIGKVPAVAFAGLSSQNAGVITIANAVFGSNPPIYPEVLARAFQLNANIVKDLQAKCRPTNHPRRSSRSSSSRREEAEDSRLTEIITEPDREKKAREAAKIGSPSIVQPTQGSPSRSD